VSQAWSCHWQGITILIDVYFMFLYMGYFEAFLSFRDHINHLDLDINHIQILFINRSVRFTH
jgi:hypothetical protein